jgi:hypothetical protein
VEERKRMNIVLTILNAIDLMAEIATIAKEERDDRLAEKQS